MADIVLSFSRVQTYQKCPWLYHLVYNEGWRAGPKAPAALGQSLHQTLGHYLDPSNTDRSLDRLLALYDEDWVNEGFGTPQETFEIYESGKKMLEHFFKLDQDRTSEILFTEKDFGFDWNGTHVQGSIDRLDKTADGAYEIIEYKTRGDRWTPERVENDHQMTFYWWGATEGLGCKPVRLRYYFLSTGESVVAKRDESHLSKLKNILETMSKKLSANDYTPNHSHCDKCEMGKRCVNFKSTKLVQK